MVNELKAVQTLASYWTGNYWKAVTYADCDKIKAAFKELTAWNTRADTGRLSELEAKVARLREALEVAEQAYQTGILFDEADLHGRAIVLRRAALEAQS